MRSLKLVSLCALCISLFACAAPAPVPNGQILAVSVSDEARYTPRISPEIGLKVPVIDQIPTLPRQGDEMLYEFEVSAALQDAFDAMAGGDLTTALAAFDRAAEQDLATASFQWFVAYQKAFALSLAGRATEAEEMARKAGEIEQSLTGSTMAMQALLGDTYMRLGRFDEARLAYLKVMSGLAGWDFPDSFAGPPTNMVHLTLSAEARIRALLGMGVLLTQTGEYEAALPWASAAEKTIATVWQVKNDPLYGPFIGELHPDVFFARAINQLVIGAAKIVVEGQSAAGDAHFTAARSIFTGLGMVQGGAYELTFKAQALARAEKIIEAKAAAEAAIAASRGSGLLDFVWRVQVVLADMLLRAGIPEQAEATFREAQSTVSQLSGIMGSDRAKRRFGVGKEDITYHLAKLDFESGKINQLFADLEAGRARAFVDMLGQVRLPGAELVVSATESAALELLRGEVSDQGGNVGGVQTALKAREEKIADLVQQRPNLAEAFSAKPHPLPGVQQFLQDGQNLLYFLPARGADPIRYLQATNRSAELITLDISADGLSALLEELLDSLETLDVAAQQQVMSRLSAAFNVGSFNQASQIAVVPSGDVHFIPWGALEVQVPVAVWPTGSWGVQSQQRGQAVGQAVVVGDPDFSSLLPQLPGARDEAIEVASLLNVTPLIGPDATERGIRAAVGKGASVLHLATHGVFNPNDPLNSTLFLVRENGDMKLTARDIFEDPLTADVVILSACETGIGTAEAGDDFLGLPRSFYLSGARHVVSSLWPVDDAGTKLFMSRFHKELAAGNDIGAAWLAARDEVKEAGMAPWVYGAFILGGAG